MVGSLGSLGFVGCCPRWVFGTLVRYCLYFGPTMSYQGSPWPFWMIASPSWWRMSQGLTLLCPWSPVMSRVMACWRSLGGMLVCCESCCSCFWLGGPAYCARFLPTSIIMLWLVYLLSFCDMIL